MTSDPKRCPKCGHTSRRVIRVWQDPQRRVVIRRNACENEDCGARWRTEEAFSAIEESDEKKKTATNSA